MGCPTGIRKMPHKKRKGAATPSRRTLPLRASLIAMAIAGMTVTTAPNMALAQSYKFSTVQIDGNNRIESGTILSYAGIERGKTVSIGELNDAYQRIVASGLFETVEIAPQGNRLVIKVVEFPTINLINFEGNRRLKDAQLEGLIRSKSRLVFSPTTAEQDAAAIAKAYADSGRLAARVTPRIIRRSDNRVDLVFEIFEGRNSEISRIGFVGNTVFSDRRLRRVLESKQAGLLRQVIRSDTFAEDRLAFDQQVLKDFYFSRGYVDFRTTSVNAELARERDGYFVTFNIQEGQQFRFGEISVVSDYPEADADFYDSVVKIKEGSVYSPTLVEAAIGRIEGLAVRDGLDFLRVEPRIVRNDRELTLDIEFVLSRGPRVFVERIDIEGNTSTLDRVVRHQFRISEGDPFNPREIRESAERIRALGYFKTAAVNAREGSSPDRVVVDVDVEEQATGSFQIGGTYSTNGGFGLALSFNERNFLGRGQQVTLNFSGASSNRNYGISFREPAFLGREVGLLFDFGFLETENDAAKYNTTVGKFGLGLDFAISDRSRMGLRYGVDFSEMSSSGSTVGSIVASDIAQGEIYSQYLGYKLSYDTRRAQIDPNKRLLLEFGQDFHGLGGNVSYLKTTGRAVAQARVLNEEVTLRASFKGGMLNYSKGTSRILDRQVLLDDSIRGFKPGGVGPRQFDPSNASAGNDALYGNMYFVGSLEAEFPIGLPEEYGIFGGAFYDVSNIWDIGGSSGSNVLYSGGKTRHVVGVSLFWDTPIGPLQFNFSKALQKETYDEEQTFNLTVRTEF